MWKHVRHRIYAYLNISNEGVILYYDGNVKFETLNVGAKVHGDLEVTDDLQVNDDATINDSLTVGGNSNFASNTVQITNSKVTAARFEGKADKAGTLDIGSTNDARKLLVLLTKRTQGNEGAGEGMSITRDVGLELKCKFK